VSRPFVFCLISSALATAWVARAEAREIEWRSLNVSARLDVDGALHIREQHQMVFTGDWNGGERRFSVGPTEWVRFVSMAGIEADGEERFMLAGKLDVVDGYQWQPVERLLRWRSRRPNDPVFDHTELGYRIDYVLSGAVRGDEGGNYALSHDFAFERDSEIDRLHVRLAIDPGWSTSVPTPIELSLEHVQPKESARLELSLRYSGAQLPTLAHRSQPRAPITLPPPPPRPPLLSRLWGDGRIWASVTFLALVAALLQALFARSRKLGHFEPLPRQEDIDRRWINEHVLALKPEVVGAAYDRHTGQAEVAALLARLEQEGKLASILTEPAGEAGTRRLELELRAPRETFEGYERALIDKLFVAGERTNAALLREHYKAFNPSRVLDRPLADKLRSLLGPRGGSDEGLSPWPVAIGFVSVWVLIKSSVRLISGWSSWWSESALELLIGLVLVISVLFGHLIASIYRQQPQATEDDPSLWGWCAFVAGLVLVPLLLPEQAAPFEIALQLASGFGIATFFVMTAWPRDHATGLVLRKKLLTARMFFEAQLQKEKPDLDDRWYPYLIALDLRSAMDAWAASFDNRPVREEESTSWSGSREEPDSTVSREEAPAPWTGGGGSFGGGGASGSWGSAVGELTASISQPASSPESSAGAGGSGSVPSLARERASSSSRSSSGGGSAGGW
jgi:uncharacterized membrane protein YgcG